MKALVLGAGGQVGRAIAAAAPAEVELVAFDRAACDVADPEVVEREPTAVLSVFVADRPGHDRRYAIDATKAVRELGYAPSRSFAQGLAETFAWYLANEAWWRRLLDGSYREWIDRHYGGPGGGR